MPKISESRKRDREERVYSLLQRYPDGLTEHEIAETLNFKRRTTHNYLQQLDLEGKVYKDGRRWYVLPRQTVVMRRFEPQPEEAMILYLAARLFVKQSDYRNETAETVLVKLADILGSDVGLGDDLLEAARELAQRPKAPDYEDILRTIIRGYVYRRQVQIIYHPYRSEPFETTICPYLLEPSAIGFATYVICHSSVVNERRTYKIGRILQSKLTRQEYVIPADFPGLEVLRNAWSIFYGDEVTKVVLRFHPEVVRRVQETTWHPSQQVAWDENQPNHLILTVKVADTTDFKPWIRGWGANCEVLEPSELRDEMMGEARRIAELYGWYTSRSSRRTHEDDPLGLANTLNDFFG